MTFEIAPGNEFHGHGAILRDAAGFPRQLPLPVAVQHGWMYQVYSARWQAASPLRLHWVWSDRARDLMRRAGADDVRVLGAPFVYLAAPRALRDRAARGTVVFPAHSSELTDLDCDFDRYADALCRLDREFQPVTVCLYWLDVRRGRDAPFRRRGLPVVTCGHRRDPRFLRNFLRIASACRFASANRVGTSALYAVYLGLRFFPTGPDAVYRNLRETHTPLGPMPEDPGAIAPLLDALGPAHRDDPDVPFEAAAEELGLRHRADRCSLRRLLWDAMTCRYFGLIFRRSPPVRLAVQVTRPLRADVSRGTA